ncbi:MAG: hypothetical protein J5501_06120 [Ruminococcus sp.]|nr:hypothetical protein [Ruminococcus sp.]
MTKMTTETMMQANGGKYRYRCSRCGRKFRTWIAIKIHNAVHHSNPIIFSEI